MSLLINESIDSLVFVVALVLGNLPPQDVVLVLLILLGIFFVNFNVVHTFQQFIKSDPIFLVFQVLGLFDAFKVYWLLLVFANSIIIQSLLHDFVVPE